LDWCREFLEAHSLQQAGLIRYSRGHITILNRDGLEDCACECYSTIRAETGNGSRLGHLPDRERMSCQLRRSAFVLLLGRLALKF
jgi:hypothetical protein